MAPLPVLDRVRSASEVLREAQADRARPVLNAPGLDAADARGAVATDADRRVFIRRVSHATPTTPMMMNNELVADLAITWARNVAVAGVDMNGCIKRMYEEAFAREPEEWETKEATAFIAKQFTPVTGLQEFAQVLFNSAEFIYVQ